MIKPSVARNTSTFRNPLLSILFSPPSSSLLFPSLPFSSSPVLFEYSFCTNQHQRLNQPRSPSTSFRANLHPSSRLYVPVCCMHIYYISTSACTYVVLVSIFEYKSACNMCWRRALHKAAKHLLREKLRAQNLLCLWEKPFTQSSLPPGSFCKHTFTPCTPFISTHLPASTSSCVCKGIST